MQDIRSWSTGGMERAGINAWATFLWDIKKLGSPGIDLPHCLLIWIAVFFLSQKGTSFPEVDAEVFRYELQRFWCGSQFNLWCLSKEPLYPGCTGKQRQFSISQQYVSALFSQWCRAFLPDMPFLHKPGIWHGFKKNKNNTDVHSRHHSHMNQQGPN